MNKKKFPNDRIKYGSEGFFLTYLSTFQIILGADLEMYTKSDDQMFNKTNPCNIYLILKRPKITIDPNSFKSDGNIGHFDLIAHTRNSTKIIKLGIELKEAKSKLKLKTSYPFNLFSIEDRKSPLLVARPGSIIDTVKDTYSYTFLDFEVLYVGQSFGKNGKRTALNRLQSHETLQKIYTHALTENPESDIWILLTNFSTISTLFCSGTKEIIPNANNHKRDTKLIDHFFSNKGLKLTEKQIINLTEAALIKYFQPKYNKIFKNDFPSATHSSYSEYYDLDIRAINIELDTSELNRKLYTAHTRRKIHHSAMYELKNDNERLSLINVLKK